MKLYQINMPKPAGIIGNAKQKSEISVRLLSQIKLAGGLRINIAAGYPISVALKNVFFVNGINSTILQDTKKA